MVAGLRSEDKEKILLTDIEKFSTVSILNKMYGGAFSANPSAGLNSYVKELQTHDSKSLLPIVKELIKEKL